MDDDILAGALQISDCFRAMENGNPFCIGRNGTIELEVLYFYLVRRKDAAYPIPYPERLHTEIQRNAGIFPGTFRAIDNWCEAYLSALQSFTGLAAGWYAPLKVIEHGILAKYAPQVKFKMPLRSLEPYYVVKQHWWTQHLAGKKVAVVSSFASTMSKQLWKMDAVWTGERGGLIPAGEVADWSFIQTGYAPITALGVGGWPAGIASWKEAVELLKSRVLESGAQVALIGCGGLGMILAAALREHGVSSIVLGGAIQVLFGIRGARWERHDVISKFWNPAWTWPAPEEIPNGAHFIEGACYWRRV